MPHSIQVTGVIERKDLRLLRFMVIPSPAIAAWKLRETTVVEGTLNGHDLGRRSPEEMG